MMYASPVCGMMGAAMKLRNKLCYGAIFFIVMLVSVLTITESVWRFDPDRDYIVTYLSKSSEVYELVGEYKESNVTRMVNVVGGSSSPSYKEITLVVRGSKGSSKIRLKLMGQEDNRIVSLETLN